MRHPSRLCGGLIAAAVAFSSSAAAAVPTLAQLAPRALPERRLQSLPQVQNFVGAAFLRFFEPVRVYVRRDRLRAVQFADQYIQ